MKIGSLVVITFKDHCFTKGGATPPLKCAVVGWVTHSDKEAVVVAPWVADDNLQDDNNDTYTILRHPGMKIKVLARK